MGRTRRKLSITESREQRRRAFFFVSSLTSPKTCATVECVESPGWDEDSQRGGPHVLHLTYTRKSQSTEVYNVGDMGGWHERSTGRAGKKTPKDGRCLLVVGVGSSYVKGTANWARKLIMGVLGNPNGWSDIRTAAIHCLFALQRHTQSLN